MPGQVLRGCARCGKPFTPRHARHRWCPRCEPHGNAHRSPTTRTRPSSSRERERILAEVLAANPLCAIRGPGCTRVATCADHIVPAAEGGRYELANLRSACQTCNSSLGGQLAHKDTVAMNEAVAEPATRWVPPGRLH